MPVQPVARAPRPRLTPEQIAHQEAEVKKANAFRDAFAGTYGLKEYKVSGHNAGIILRSGGADKHLVRRLLGNGWSERIRLASGPFDHSELWGRDGKPMALVGHPYDLGDDDLALLDEIRGLGLHVTTDMDSHYGYGTHRVIVWHADLEPIR